MVGFGIYNIIVSTMLIIFSIYFIKETNEDIKESEEYKKKHNAEWKDEFIKSYKKYRFLYYSILLISVLIILFTLFIFTIKFMEVL